MINQFQNFKLKLFQNKKTKTILVFLLFFLFPLTSLFSYNDTDTHPDLTVEIVKLYNLQSKENKLLGEEMELVRQGSMLEDTAPRWINHFYNPETGEGWTADNLKGVSQKNMRTVSDWFFSSEKPVSSLNWARNQELQNRYSLYQGNHTWQKAVYDYASGNKEQGLRSLGFLLHLIEDASVPDHTRDDTHADISNKKDNADEGSPYEDWAENYTKNNILTIAETLNNQNKKYYKCGNFDECLINLAKYSHYNFFSEDTIFEFESPKIFREEKLNDKNYYYNENENILAKSYEIEDNKIYTLRDPLIMSSYWSYLSSEAVLTGAGVIETFFKDVEKAKSDPQYLENLKFKEKQMTLAQSSFMPVVFLFADKMISPAGEIFRIGRAYSGAKDTVNNFANNIVSVVKSLFGATGNQQAGLPVLELSGNANGENQDADATAQARSQQGEVPLLNGFEEGGETSSGINNQMAPDVLTNQSQDNFAPSPQKPPTSAVNQTLNNNTNNQTSNNAALNSTQNQNKQNSDDVPTPNFGFAGFYGAASGPPPGFGGGEAVPPRRDGNNQLPIINNQTNSNNQNQNENQNTASSTNATSTENQIEPDTTPPESPVLLFPSDLNQTFNSQSVEFSGTAEPSSTLLAKSDLASKATTTVSGTGIWSLLLTLNQGTTTISFFARDQNGNQSSSTDIEVFIDSLAPQISDFKILECDNSMAADGCLIATTTINLIWSANSDDLDYYELVWNSESEGQIATTSTSTILVLTEGEHTLSLLARDKAGNFSEPSVQSLEINLKPIVINEIAWMGTGPQTSSDEWVELYNRTNKEINLNSFTLYASDLKPYIKLQGNIFAKNYFLLERTDDDNTVLDIKADQFFTGSIENQREDLFLVYISHNGTTTIDYTKSCTQFGHWCGGSTNGYASMERYSPDEDNWGTNLMLIKNGQNAKGGAINGTPKARNSLNYLITSRSENRITKDIVLKKENSPYFVYDTVTVPQGKKLTIEPGVVIKFKSGGNNFLNIEGELVAEGREGGENKIVFTSFYDDTHGGNTDGDSGVSLPRPGDWTSVSLQNNSSSTISHSLFRYGGTHYGFCCNGMLNVEATSTITNSIFEYSYGYGAQIINNGSVIADNIFRNNNNYPQFSGAAGVNIGAGAPKIINNIFEENYYGAYVSGGSRAEFEDNIFNNNASKAVFVSGNDGMGSFKNNYGVLSADPKDGIYISNLNIRSGTETTLHSNSLPYVFHNNPYIAASSSLVIKSGVLIKNTESNRIEVYGSLYAEGENPQDIVFTALSDNSYWFGVSANPGSTVVLKGTTIKRGGKISSFGSLEKEAALYANKADINLENVLFEENYKNGAAFVNSSSLIKNSEFKNHTLPETGSRALSYHGSEINLENTAFRNNFLGIYADANSLLGTIISPIIFEGNTGTSTVNLFP